MSEIMCANAWVSTEMKHTVELSSRTFIACGGKPHAVYSINGGLYPGTHKQPGFQTLIVWLTAAQKGKVWVNMQLVYGQSSLSPWKDWINRNWFGDRTVLEGVWVISRDASEMRNSWRFHSKLGEVSLFFVCTDEGALSVLRPVAGENIKQKRWKETTQTS